MVLMWLWRVMASVMSLRISLGAARSNATVGWVRSGNAAFALAGAAC